MDHSQFIPVVLVKADGSDGKKGIKVGKDRYSFLEDSYPTEDDTMTSGLQILYARPTCIKSPRLFYFKFLSICVDINKSVKYPIGEIIKIS